jgi:hypothetical protein
LAARVLTGDSPLELVKTSGSSHGGEHAAAVNMEVSNPCINETDKVIRSPEGDLYRTAGNELGAKMKQNDSALHEGMGTRPTRSWLLSPATKPERFAKAKEL